MQFTNKKIKIIFLLLVGLGFAPITAAVAQTDPSTIGRWSLGPNLPFFPVHAHMLPTGKVMIWPGDGGISGDDPRAWDPATGVVTQLAKPGYDLFCTGHSFLADGRLLVTGGTLDYAFTGFPNASIYNPFTDSWSAMPNMNAGRWYPNNTTLANGDVLVVSGQINPTLGENILPQVFQTATGTWRNLTNAQLALDLYPRMHLAPNGKVFVSGMSYQSRYLDTSGTGAWTFVGNMSRSRAYGSSVMYDNGKVLVMGGDDPPVNTAEVIDLNAASPAWRLIGSMAIARRQLNATVLPDGQVLVTGGSSGAGFNDATHPVYAAEMWNPSTETWTTMASASIPRLYHSAVVLLPDGRLLSTGGNGYPQAEIYEPPYLFKGARPAITSAPSSVSYGQTFFVQTPDAAGITQATWIRLSSTTHAFNMDQRFSRLSFSQAAGGLNVVAPSSANLSPPGYYLLFLLNGNGVPSVAKIIQIQPAGTNPVPDLTTLSPSSATPGGAAFTLTVNGFNFVSGSTVRWNGANRTTTFVNSTQLTASIPAGDIASAGTAQVTVFNPSPGGGTSNALNFTISSTSCPTGQYLAQYYNNMNLTGSPTFTACEPSVNYNWGEGTPGNGVNTDNFSVRWTGRFNFNADSYTFTATADDGIRVWVDGNLIINAWVEQPPTTYQATLNLTQGEHEVKVEYYENFYGAVAQVSWQGANLPGTLQFSAATYSANENGANTTITITRTGGSAGAVGVSFSSSNGTATAGSDYTTTTQTITFANGDTANKTVTIPILDDTTFEGNETVNLTLSSPTGGATLGSPSTATLTIVDNEAAPAGALQFSSATYSVNENGGNATVTITRTGGSAGAVGVSFSTSNGSATAGSDYTTTTQTVSFANGDTANKTVNVPILDDTTFEGNETVNLALSSPTGGATLGSPSTATLTIVDNEAPNPVPVLTSLVPSNATAGGAGFTLTVNGNDFVSGSVVQWNASARSTTFVSATQVTATIPNTDIAAAGTAQVTVVNPAPGGGISNTLTFTIDADTIAPDTNITATPPNPSNSSSASFSLTSNEPGSFQCQLDAGGFVSCASPQNYANLSNGSHTFEVRAVDGAGNVDPTPASYAWIVDVLAPDTSITANPPNPSNNGNASFTFTSTESGSFQCRLDGSPFTVCASPQTYNNLSIGVHNFEVRAIDIAGNIDPTPASYTWTYVPVTVYPSATTIQAGSLRSGSFASLNADDNNYYEVNSTTSGTRTTSWYAAFTGVSNGLTNLKITYKGKISRNNTQTIAIWRWTTSTWVQLDSRKVSNTEIEIANLSPTGSLGDYVSPSGELRVQVNSTGSGTQNFFSSGDLARIVFDVP